MRQYIYRSFLFIMVMSMVAAAKAQIPSYVFVSNDFEQLDANNVLIKWMTDSVFFPKGVNIYRQENGSSSWIKLTEEPVKAMSELPTSGLMLTQNEQVFGYLAINPTYDEFFKNAFLRAVILSEAMKSQPLAKVIGVYFKDETATKGKTYRYKVEAEKAMGTQLIGVSNEIIVGPYTPIAPPDSLWVNREKKVVQFKWMLAEERFSFVNIQKSSNGVDFVDLTDAPIYISPVKSETGALVYPEILFTDGKIKKKEDYWYRLAGIDYFGQSGAYSAPIKAAYEDLEPPASPTTLTLAKSDSAMTIMASWEYPDGVDDLKGFMLMKQRGDMDTAIVAHTNLIDPKLRAHTINMDIPAAYLITVVAIDNNDNTSYSDSRIIKVADRRAPSQPKGLEVSIDSGVVSLTWEANQEADLMGYWLMRGLSENNAVSYVPLAGKPILNTTYRDTLGSAVRNSFMYHIIAVDTNYNKSLPSTDMSITAPDVEAPGAPVITQIGNGDAALSVQWLASPDDDVSTYQVIRKTDGIMKNMAVEPSQVSYSDTEIVPGKTYDYSIVAIDEQGNVSDTSNVYRITAKGQDMSMFDKIKPSRLNGKYIKSKKHVELSWEQVFDEQSLGVVLYRGTSEKSLTTINSLSRKAGFKDTRAKPGNTYYYQLRTFASNGAKHKSDIISVTIKEQKK